MQTIHPLHCNRIASSRTGEPECNYLDRWKKKTKKFTHHIKSDVLHRHMKSVGQITSCTLVYHTEILVPYSQAAKLSVELTVDEKVWRANRFKQPRSLRYALPESKLQVCSVYVIPVERQHGMVAKRK